MKCITFDKLGLLISLFTGVRLGELCGLKWSDINFNLKYLKIERTVQRIKNFNMNNAPKTILSIDEPKSMNSKRQIVIVDQLLEIITELKQKDNLYILSNSEKPLDPRSFEIRYKNILKHANVDYKNFHTCRHTFATNCIREGMNTKILSQILGHASVKTTLDLYVHPNMEEIAQNIALINNRIKLHS